MFLKHIHVCLQCSEPFLVICTCFFFSPEKRIISNSGCSRNVNQENDGFEVWATGFGTKGDFFGLAEILDWAKYQEHSRRLQQISFFPIMQREQELLSLYNCFAVDSADRPLISVSYVASSCLDKKNIKHPVTKLSLEGEAGWRQHPAAGVLQHLWQENWTGLRKSCIDLSIRHWMRTCSRV